MAKDWSGLPDRCGSYYKEAATTSKLGADMNDPEMNTLVIQTATAAGLRVNVNGKMLNDNYTNVMGSFPSLVRFARALLARQPAAIDKEAVTLDQVKALESAVCNGQSGEALRLLHHMRNALAAPLANGASKPACAHRIVDARNEIVKSGYLCVDCGAVFAGIHAPAAPSVEQDERGAMRREWDKVLGFAKRIVSMLDTTDVMRSSVSGTAYDAAERAVFIRNIAQKQIESIDRAASTSANVAQYRNEALSALLVDHSHAASAKDVDAVLKARDAIYSMFANVAQGAEAKLEFMPVDSMQHAIVYGSKAAIGALKARMERDYRIASLVPAPPAQTAITEQMLEKLYWTAMDNSADILKYMEEAIALTAAQSASGETK